MDFIKDFTITPQENSQVLITGEIPYAFLEKERTAAIAKLGANVSIDGFRKGHVPEKILVEHVGDMALLSEMAERAISKMYPALIKERGLDVIGYPQIQITKIAKDNPLGFTITVAVVPTLELPDYKQIAIAKNKEKDTVSVTDEDVETQIKEIQRSKLAYERLQQKASVDPVTDADEATDEATEPHVHDEHCDHDHEKSTDKAITDADLPELTDEYVKTLGQPGQFENVADFKAKLKEHLTLEKEREAAAKLRAGITDDIIAQTTVTLPQVLIDSELAQMFGQMEEELKRSGLKIEEYLTHIKKTKEELAQEWKPTAEKRATLQLILNEIAKKESITPDETETKQQVDQLMTHYKDAEESRVRAYVETVLANEAVLKMLETQE